MKLVYGILTGLIILAVILISILVVYYSNEYNYNYYVKYNNGDEFVQLDYAKCYPDTSGNGLVVKCYDDKSGSPAYSAEVVEYKKVEK